MSGANAGSRYVPAMFFPMSKMEGREDGDEMDVLCGQQLGCWVPSELNSDQRRGTVGSASLDLSGWLRCKRQSKNVTSNPGREEVYEQH